MACREQKDHEFLRFSFEQLTKNDSTLNPKKMKKIFLTLAATSVIAAASAQNAKDLSLNSSASITKSSFIHDGLAKSFDAVDVNAKAIAHFIANYQQASDVQWSVLQDGFRVFFSDHGNLNRVYYDKKGNWKFGVSYYGESKMAKDIRAQIKSAYYDFSIKSVQEITLPDKKVYMVYIECGNSTKQLRLCDGELEIVDDFKNPD